MQANNAPPDHPPGTACPICNLAGKVERKSNRFESRMNFSASGIPGGAFLCTFVLFGSFQNLMHDTASILCSLNHYLAKYAPKRHILPSCGPSWGASSGPEGAAVRVRQSASRCQSRTGLNYALLFHDSGIYPVFLLIQHVLLLQARVLQPKSDRVQGFVDDKVERVQSRIGLKVG